MADLYAPNYDPKKPANVPPLASNIVMVNKFDLRLVLAAMTDPMMQEEAAVKNAVARLAEEVS